MAKGQGDKSQEELLKRYGTLTRFMTDTVLHRMS